MNDHQSSASHESSTTNAFPLMMDAGPHQLTAAMLVLLGMIAVIASVLGFQHIGGYIPCKLCLAQREPYYAAIPLVAIAALSAWRGWPACVVRGLLAIAGLLLIYTLALAAFHSGVEWGWWQGPSDCGAVAGGEVTDAGSLLNKLATAKPPSCDEAAGRFLGLSFAGWNVVVSGVLAFIAFRGAFGLSK